MARLRHEQTVIPPAQPRRDVDAARASYDDHLDQSSTLRGILSAASASTSASSC